MSLRIRKATSTDKEEIWNILKPVFRAGESYPVARDITQEAGLAYWFAPDKTIHVAEQDGLMLGTYYIKPNTGGPGDHICNCGYVTSQNARSKGIAQAMCRHSLDIARTQGYRGMQYNLVVATNEPAVRLWQHMGFEIVGQLPGVFAHPTHGDVDAFVMFQKL